MRIGELANEVGVSADTIRFYERSGWLPRPGRRDNNYRDYGQADIDHLRLLIDLRRMDLPLDLAAEMAGWCHRAIARTRPPPCPRSSTTRDRSSRTASLACASWTRASRTSSVISPSLHRS